jgi:hypothetical protein
MFERHNKEEGMANIKQMHIFFKEENNTVTIERVKVTGGGPPEEVEERPGNGPSGRLLGNLVTFTGSNCISLNMPGGGFYQICF